MESSARAVITKAVRLDAQEAPRRDAARVDSESKAAGVKLEEARAENKPKFRPKQRTIMKRSAKTPKAEFHKGGEAVLTNGVYEGAPRIFLELRNDPKWPNVQERNGSIRSRPVVWLKLFSSPLLRERR